MISEEKAINFGGQLWTSQDGKIRRVYFGVKLMTEVLDLDVTRYGTGNIRSATMGDNRISNAEASRILGTKVFVQNGKIHVQSSAHAADEIADAFHRALTTN